MTLDELLQHIPEDKRGDAKTFLDNHGKITADKVTEFQKSDDGKKFFQPLLDAYAQKAIGTHDKKFMDEKFPGLLEEEIKKRYPGEDPKDKQVKDLTAKLEKMELDGKRDKQLARAQKALADAKLPLSLAEKYVGLTDEETDTALGAAIKEITEWHTSGIKAEVDKITGGAPGGGSQNPPDGFENDMLKRINKT